MGKSGTGKDTVANKLINDYGYNKLVTYTTRPIRHNEIPDKTYHYINEKDFKEKLHEVFFAEWKIYHTIQGDWYYGSAREDYMNDNDKTVVILTPDGVKKLRMQGIKETVIYLDSSLKTIRKRLLERGDDIEELERRIVSDIKDFRDAEYYADKIIYNEEISDIDNIVDEILKFVESKNERL